jgi:hypothetical protein
LTFASLLTTFAAAFVANDGEQLASLFTEDGTYKDGFSGPIPAGRRSRRCCSGFTTPGGMSPWCNWTFRPSALNGCSSGLRRPKPAP